MWFALVYSPKLYSGQVELLLARRAHDDSRSSTLKRVLESSREIYESAKQRLNELGMTPSQIAELERVGEAKSRMHLCAPISGTVIEKLAVEGQYVKEGQAIYRLADLSTVWLMLELYPEDAAHIRFGPTKIDCFCARLCSNACELNRTDKSVDRGQPARIHSDIL